MLEDLGIALIVLMVLVLLLPKIMAKNRIVSFCQKFGEYWAIDKVFKIVQFSASGISALIQRTYSHDHVLNLQGTLGEIQEFVVVIKISRKILRFLRGGPIIQRLRLSTFTFKRRSEQNMGKEMENNFKILADLFLALFFLTDHLVFFSWVGLTHNDSLRIHYSEYSKIFLILFQSFNFLRLLCLFSHLKKRQGTKFRMGICDFCANVTDLIRISCTFNGSISGQVQASMAIFSSLAKLARLKFK